MSGSPTLHDRLALMVITDPGARIGVAEAARAALTAGAPGIQLRNKRATTAELLAMAVELRAATRSSGALLIVNDRVDVALAADADGAHLGDDDLPLEAARRIVPEGFIFGRSVDTPAEARSAEEAGADYLGVGPIYGTGTKRDAGPLVGERGLEVFRKVVGIPILAIGGIGVDHAGGAIRAGADGVAVVGAVMFSADPGLATAALMREISAARRAVSGSR